MLYFHGWMLMINVGFVLPLSIGIMALRSTRVHRASVHASLQVAFIVLLFVSIAYARESATWHGTLGYVLAYGGVPLVLWTRFLHNPIWHILVGRVFAILCFIQSFYGTYLTYDLRFQALSYIILSLGFLFYVVAVTATAVGKKEVRRVRDGTYQGLSADVMVEGAGWSLYLARMRGRIHTLSMRKVKGRHKDANGVEWWGAGTTIQELQWHLTSQQLSLAGHPSLAAATLGGWIFTGSHGSGGTLWTPAFGKIKVYDKEEKTVKVISNKKVLFHDRATTTQQSRYIVLEVEVRPVRNALCTRIAFDVHSTADAQRLVLSESYIRMIFVDKGSALAFMWIPYDDSLASRCTFVPPWLATILPPGISARMARSQWTRHQRLSEANKFAPDPPFFVSLFMVVYVNFEVFVDIRVTPHLIMQLCEELRVLFSTSANGRCEVRFGSDKLFLDFALTSRNYAAVFSTVQKVVGHQPISLHKGKAQVPVLPMSLQTAHVPHHAHV